MSPRELIILLLGLAIVGVVLRGLYVGIRARRNQIRLAIDKNIPQDVDLDELELSELPGGGARVVSRDGVAEKPQQGTPSKASPRSAIDRARARAAAMDLDDEDEQIPVLMDAVTVADTQADDEDRHEISDAQDDDDFAPDQTRAESDASPDRDDTDHHESARQSPADEDEDVLLDYDLRDPSSAEDPMASVRPDYEDDEAQTARSHADAADYGENETGPVPDADAFPDMEEETETVTDEEDEEHWSSHAVEADSELEDLNERSAAQAAHEDVQVEESQNPAIFDDSLGDFSLPAGDRIGFERRTPTLKAVDQRALFDEGDEDVDKRTVAPAEADKPPPKRKSLFSAFTRRHAENPPAPARQEEEATEQAPAATAAPANPARGQESRPGDSAAANNSLQQPSEVLVINVMAREGRAFAGEELLEVLITTGLKFGDMQIFHHRLGGDPKGPVVFSVANILNPGTFDLNAMEQFSTVGISFFLALPAPMNNLEAFEQMLATARHIQKQMDGELKDDNRNGMTAQTIEHYRERVRNFELRQLKAAGSRG